MENHEVVTSTRNHKPWFIALAGGLVIALGGFGYSIHRSNQLSELISKNQSGALEQISQLKAENAALRSQQQETADSFSQELKSANEDATAALRKARADAQRKQEELAKQLSETHQALAGMTDEVTTLRNTTDKQLTEVADNVNAVKTNVDAVQSNVDTVKADLGTTKEELAKTGADLRAAIGDMGVMSGLIATNGDELKELRALGERNYVEFNLTKKAGQQRVGDVMLTLKKSDVKHNKFTLDVMADDKKVQKKDKTINEPVQFYVLGSRQPYEIVVNQVSKDRIVGYLSTPKVKMPKLSASR